MAKTVNTKITFSAPLEFKETITSLKKEYNLKSVSALLQEAVKTYMQQKELQRWERGAEVMAQEYETNKELKEWAEFIDDKY